MYIGLDVHKLSIQIASVKNASSPVIESRQIDTKIETIIQFANSLSKKDSVVLENTTHSSPIATLLRRNGANVVISNPFLTKSMTKTKRKTDKIDAEKLARLLASGILPLVWQPSPEIEKMRKLISFANALICQRTMIKNRIHSILHRNLISYSEIPELFNSKGRIFLNKVVLPEEERFQINIELENLDFTEKEIETVKKRIAIKVMADKESKRLMTMPGIDFYTALSLKAAIGDIKRFKEPSKLVNYFGLSPSISQSGNSCYLGPITKQGRTHARWVLIQAAHFAVITPGPLRSFFRRIKRKTVRNVAIVAVASKMTRIIWNLLMKDQDYLYAHPLRTKEKFAKLRIIATGVRLKTRKREVLPSNGGRKGYLEARIHDHDNAIKGEQTYEEFVNNRIPDSLK